MEAVSKLLGLLRTSHGLKNNVSEKYFAHYFILAHMLSGLFSLTLSI
jgi:hypothetical protein